MAQKLFKISFKSSDFLVVKYKLNGWTVLKILCHKNGGAQRDIQMWGKTVHCKNNESILKCNEIFFKNFSDEKI